MHIIHPLSITTLATAAVALTMSVVAAYAQCVPNDLNCMNMP